MPRQLEFQDTATRQQPINAPRFPVVLILDGLSNPSNAGSIFRLADATRVRHVFLYKMDGMASSRKFLKAARSTQHCVPWSYLGELSEIENLKSTYQLVGLEITDNSRPFGEFQPSGPVALVIGNEKNGVSQGLLNLTEACIHLPMYGLNTSLNVAMAAGVAVYDLLEKVRRKQLKF